MTIEQALINKLVENGLFEEQAIEVMELVKNDNKNVKMIGRWNDNVSDYPDFLISVIWLITKQITLDYINTNMPDICYKPLFED